MGARDDLAAEIEDLTEEQAVLVRDWARMLMRRIHPKDRRSASPLADMLGIKNDGTGEDGIARFSVTVEPAHFNPHGVLHGGVIYTMIDSCMGAAVMARLEPPNFCATIELKVSYLEGVRGGRLLAEAEVVKEGRTIAFVDSRVRDDNGRIVATASGSMFIFRQEGQ
jgi:acyl-CoA thioesterase